MREIRVKEEFGISVSSNASKISAFVASLLRRMQRCEVVIVWNDLAGVDDQSSERRGIVRSPHTNGISIIGFTEDGSSSFR